jgi:hypothetical protein
MELAAQTELVELQAQAELLVRVELQGLQVYQVWMEQMGQVVL